MRKTTLILAVHIISLVNIVCVDAATADQWRNRTIYQVITDRFARTNGDTSACADLTSYCGGTFKGITNNLAYIQNLGFDAIWISPVVTNYGNNYHGYAATNLYTINSHFGTSADLVALVQACHARKMYVMIDVVPNHMAAVGSSLNLLNPFNQASHFHDCKGCTGSSPPCSCGDWNNNTQVEHCQLFQLLDLDQTNTFVASALNNWIRNLTRTYGFDGIRIDTCQETAAVGGAIAPFLKSFAKTSGVYSICEVFDGRINYVASYQTLVDGTMSYPLAMALEDVFEHKKSMTEIPNTISQYNQLFTNTNLLGTFVDNHDNPRFLSVQSDQKLFQNALCYVLMSVGIPIIYYGSEQGFNGGSDPYNREPMWTSNFGTSAPLYTFVKTVVSTRKSVKIWNYPQVQRFVDDSVMVFTRGSTLIAVTNSGSGSGTVTRVVPNHPYAVGTKLCNVFYPTQDCFVIQNGQLTVNLVNGETKIYVVQTN